mmetsp:Transcript_8655/g.35626  ORF Transcript_8655/g.35626 Transcript_8655/m.35626 type:complete len:305 (-) Transcript_8655:549-1463(-)
MACRLKLSSTTHLVTTRVNVTETGVSPEVQQDQVESVVHRCMNMHSVAEQSVRALHHPEIERVNLHKAANELLPMPKLNEFLSVNIAALSHPSLYLEGKVIKTICILAHNPLPKTSASAHRRPATIVASAHGVCVWQSTVDGVVTALAGCEKCCIVGTQNGSLHLYDLLSGNVAAPCWMLSGAICYLACNGERSNASRSSREDSQSHPTDTGIVLATITRDGGFHMWDLKKMRCITSSSIAPIMNVLGYHAKDARSCIWKLRVCHTTAMVSIATQVKSAMQVQDFKFCSKTECWSPLKPGEHRA